MRRDSLGFFWTDLPVEKTPATRAERIARADRPLPPIPDTNWRAPTEFPRLDTCKVIALDTETKDPDLRTKGPGFFRGDAHVIGISVATDDRAWYFPMRHEVCPEQNLNPENVIAWAKDQLTRPGQLKVGAKIQYDLEGLAHEGVNVAGPFYDVQNAEALIDENRLQYNLDSLGRAYLGRGKEEAVLAQWVKDAYGNSNYREELWRSPPCLVGFYGEQDARMPLQIRIQQLTALSADDLLELNDMEQALIPMLLAMRQRGVRVNVARAEELSDKLEMEIQTLQFQLNKLAGCEINVDRAETIAGAFDNLGIAYPLTLKTKKPSFTKEWLEHHPSEVANRITELRKLSKFRGTFVEGYILNLNVNGRLHCLFNQLRGDDYGTVSGRFSSSLPNLQNIPARDSLWGPLIRSIFIPDEGCDWGKLDWSQIEFRMVAHYGRGPSAEEVRRLYREDAAIDFHLEVAKIIWPERAREMRKPAKNINFGLVYGMGEELLADEIGISLEEAKPIFTEYHGRMPFIKAGHDSLYKEASGLANTRGYIKTLLGRRRRFHLWEPRWMGRDERTVRALPLQTAQQEWGHKIRRAFTHKALNALIQGSAADMMKRCMVEYWHNCPSAVATLGAPMLTVHDELDFSVPLGSEGDKALQEVREVMEQTVLLKVPVMADLKRGNNWGELD
jgi:DNA polymerase I-like protein with 3'-5' exonuclease and polymerase domains